MKVQEITKHIKEEIEILATLSDENLEIKAFSLNDKFETKFTNHTLP